MNTDLLTNVPATPTTRTHARESGVISGKRIAKTERHSVGDPGALQGYSKEAGVDPLAYYCALAWIEEIDAHLSRPGGYYRVNGQAHSSLEGVIRAITGDDPVIERGQIIKRKQYPRRIPNPKRLSSGRGRYRKLPDLDQLLKLYETHTLREIGNMYGACLEAVRRHLRGTGAIEKKKAVKRLATLNRNQKKAA